MKKHYSLKTATALFLIFTLCISMFMAGCGNSEEKSNEEKEVNAKTVEFTDDCGRTVEVPEKIDSVIASGTLAQIFIQAIAPDTLIATNSEWGEETKKYIDNKYLELPEVGSFFGNHDLNYEEIAKLDPDIIIDVGEAKPSMKSDLKDITEKTNIPAVHIDADFNTSDKAFERLGELLGAEKQGKELSDYCRNAFDKVNASLKKVDNKTKVLYCCEEDGLNVLAKDSYHSQVLDMLADNVAVLEDPSSQGTGNEVNIEQMMNWDPDVIIFAPGSYYDYAADDPAWQTLKAIKTGHYYEVPMGPYNWMGYPPSCNRILGLLWTAKLLYPNETDYDLKDEVKQYYKLFYQYDLSDEGYDELVKESINK